MIATADLASFCRDLDGAPDPGAFQAAVDADPQRAERVADQLRTEVMAAVFREALNGGEAPRHRLRACSELYLRRETQQIDDELRSRSAAVDVDSLELDLVRQPDPQVRQERLRTWSNAWGELEALRFEHRHAREEAARRSGAEGLFQLRSACHPIPVAQTVAEFERGFITPLDDLVAATSRRRGAENTEQSLRDAALASHAQHWDTGSTRVLLRRLGQGLGWDPDADGPQIASGAGPSRVQFCDSGRPQLWLTELPGPWGLARGLGCFGVAARCGFLAPRAGLAWTLWSDPAFAEASSMLMTRLMLNPKFQDAFGLAAREDLERDVRFELALAPRLAWTYVSLASQGAEQDPVQVDSAMRRATGRCGTPRHKLDLSDPSPQGAAELRGMTLGLLLEEALMTRFGHAWFAERRAAAFLRDFWDAEPGQTADDLALALDLGTIEPTPLLDRCRPDAPHG